MQSLQYDENAKLQQIDTDQDGINDYEEINFYNTSRYLPDTDSDGLSDKEEIDAGGDPLCPEGQVCAQNDYSAIGDTTSTIATPISDSVQTPDQILANSQLNNTSFNSSTDNVDLNSVVNDPDALRQILLSTGQVTEEDLQGVDDETLLQLAQNLLKQNNASLTTSTAQ